MAAGGISVPEVFHVIRAMLSSCQVPFTCESVTYSLTYGRMCELW